MKLLVATTKGQGKRKNDFSWTTEGELLRFGLTCDRDVGKPDGGCGCARAFTGLDSAKATTTALVADVDLTPEQLGVKIRESLVRSGWLKADEVSDWPKEDADELIRIAGEFDIGDVIEKRGDTVQTRAVS